MGNAEEPVTNATVEDDALNNADGLLKAVNFPKPTADLNELFAILNHAENVFSQERSKDVFKYYVRYIDSGKWRLVCHRLCSGIQFLPLRISPFRYHLL
jgi:hypothetical protein